MWRDEREPRDRVLFLAQMRRALGDHELERGPHMRFAEMAGHRSPVMPADHQMNMQGRGTGGPLRNVADQ